MKRCARAFWTGRDGGVPRRFAQKRTQPFSRFWSKGQRKEWSTRGWHRFHAPIGRAGGLRTAGPAPPPQALVLVAVKRENVACRCPRNRISGMAWRRGLFSERQGGH